MGNFKVHWFSNHNHSNGNCIQMRRTSERTGGVCRDKWAEERQMERDISENGWAHLEMSRPQSTKTKSKSKRTERKSLKYTNILFDFLRFSYLVCRLKWHSFKRIGKLKAMWMWYADDDGLAVVVAAMVVMVKTKIQIELEAMEERHRNRRAHDETASAQYTTWQNVKQSRMIEKRVSGIVCMRAWTPCSAIQTSTMNLGRLRCQRQIMRSVLTSLGAHFFLSAIDQQKTKIYCTCERTVVLLAHYWSTTAFRILIRIKIILVDYIVYV